MERSEPSLVPEWLRSTTGGGTGAGTSSSHFAASQADRSSSSNSRRTSSSIGSNKHDRNSYSRSYSSFNRSHRDKYRERLTIIENWDFECSDPLRSMISGRAEGLLRHSQSMISRRQGEVQSRRVSTDNGNGTHTVGTGVTGIHKVSFDRDFPQLGTDERPKTPDIVRVSSPGLSRSIHSLSIGNSSLIGNEGWTSALAEAPSPAVSGASFNATSGAGSTLGGLNMAEALVQTPAHSTNIPQSSMQSPRDDLAISQSKKLIPMTPSLPKTLANQTDKLKPKTPVRSSEVMVVPKSGVQLLSPLQLGGQSAHGTSAKGEGPNSPSGKLLVLKPGRENGTVIKDIQSQTTTCSNRVPNNQSVSIPLKIPSNPRVSSGAEKRNFQSRSDFFNMMRKKSMNSTSVSTDACTDAEMADETDKIKEPSCAQAAPAENGRNIIFNGEICSEAESCSQSEDEKHAAIYPNEEEKAFLRLLGWEESGGDDEALTEEEINAFYQEVWRLRTTSQLCHDRWPKILSHFELRAACPSAASTEPSASTSRN